MNLDAIALSVLQKELSSFVLGARVDRVYQTSKTAICLHLYNNLIYWNIGFMFSWLFFTRLFI